MTRSRSTQVWAAAPIAAWLLCACAFEKPVNAVRPLTAGTATTSAGGSGSGGSAGASGAAGAQAPIVIRSTLSPDVVLRSSCFDYEFQSPLLPSNLLFVVDRSGSMICNPPPLTSSEQCEAEERRVDVGTPNKWQLTSSALAAAITALPETSTVGVSFFSNDDLCGVSSIPNVPLGPATVPQLNAIRGSLAGIVPKGPTPLVGAALLAYKYLQTAANSRAISGNSYVVLITDGEQSDMCSDPAYCKDADSCSELLIAESMRAASPEINIRTFVLGVPGSEHGRAVLSRLARAGGTAAASCVPEQGNCHFDVTGDPDLSSALMRALQTIAGRTLTCEFDVFNKAPGSVELTRLNVVYTPHEGEARLIPQDLSAPCDRGADGWQYDNEKKLVRLCGNTCAAVRNDRGASVTVVLGCPVLGPD